MQKSSLLAEPRRNRLRYSWFLGREYRRVGVVGPETAGLGSLFKALPGVGGGRIILFFL